MEQRALGSLQVSVIGLGCNNFGMMIDAEATKAVVDAAIDAGINYFDTAESYGKGQSEEFLGRALGSRRGDVLIASKWGFDSKAEPGRPEIIRERLDATLKRLCLAELKAEGKIREIGCTHFTAAELDDAVRAGQAKGVPTYPSVQNHYSLLTRDAETNGVFDACRRHGIAFVPYFPLESGLLTGKYQLGQARPEDARLVKWGDRAASFIDDDKLAIVGRLTQWAADHGHSLLDLAMSWHTSNPVTATVIAGSTKPEQVRANAAAGTWALTDADRAEVAALLG